MGENAPPTAANGGLPAGMGGNVPPTAANGGLPAAGEREALCRKTQLTEYDRQDQAHGRFFPVCGPDG